MKPRPLHAAVVRAVNAAVNRGISETEARAWVAPVCRSAAEIEQAIELFRRWKPPARVEQEANG